MSTQEKQEVLLKGELSEPELKSQLNEAVEQWKESFKKNAEDTIKLGIVLFTIKKYCETKDMPYLKTVQDWSDLSPAAISQYTIIGEKASLLQKKVNVLPPATRALYEAARLPSEVLEKAEFSPSMTVKDIKELNPETKKENKEKQQDIKAKKMANKISDIISTLAALRKQWDELEDELSAKKIKKLRHALETTLRTISEEEEEEDDEEEVFNIGDD